MPNQWYVQLNGKIIGPLNDSNIAQLAVNKRIDPHTYIKLNEDGDWIQARRIKGLFEKSNAQQGQKPIENNSNNNLVPTIVNTPLTAAEPAKFINPVNKSNSFLGKEAPFRSGYVSSNLLPDEIVLYWADTHWFIFVMPIVLLLFPLIVACVLGFNFGPAEFICFGFVGLPVFIVALTSLISRTFQYLFNQYAITNKRVVMKCGFLSLRTLEVLHDKIASLSVNQDLFGIIFNYGSVIVSAMGDKQTFPYIENPAGFRKRVQEQQ